MRPDLTREGGDDVLPARAGYGNDCTGLRIIKSGGGKRQRLAHVLDADNRHTSIKMFGGQNGHRTTRDGILRKNGSIRLVAGYGNEQHAGFNLPAIGRKAGHGDIADVLRLRGNLRNAPEK